MKMDKRENLHCYIMPKHLILVDMV